MTIKRGDPWGEPVRPPGDLEVAETDAELHRLVNRARSPRLAAADAAPSADVSETDVRTSAETAVVAAGLVAGGGDLARTVAAARTAVEIGDADQLVRMPIDIGRAEFGGRTVWFCSHAVIRRPGWRAWRGSLTALMNAQFVGMWDVAPRGHPNDGRIDVIATAGRFGLRQRLQARKRLATGTHLPHPALSESRLKQWRGSVDPGYSLLLDGVSYVHTGPIEVTVEPDAMFVYI